MYNDEISLNILQKSCGKYIWSLFIMMHEELTKYLFSE